MDTSRELSRCIQKINIESKVVSLFQFYVHGLTVTLIPPYLVKIFKAFQCRVRKY